MIVLSKFTRLPSFKLCFGCIIAIKSAKLRLLLWFRVDVGLTLPEYMSMRRSNAVSVNRELFFCKKLIMSGTEILKSKSLSTALNTELKSCDSLAFLISG